MLRKLSFRFAHGVRFADDIAIFVRSRKAAERVQKSVTRFLQERMKLKVNEEKSRIELPWNMKFLGFRITRMIGKTRISIHPEALHRFKERIREITKRSRGIKLLRVIQELGRFMPGWYNYYRSGISRKLRKELNRWIVRRLRMFLWCQWPLPRTKVKNLKRLGIDHATAVKLGNTRKGPWRVSDYMTMNFAMPAAWFVKNYGLFLIP